MMDRIRLDVENLDVETFDTQSAILPGTSIKIDPLTTINDPTAATRCYYCPPPTIGEPVLY